MSVSGSHFQLNGIEFGVMAPSAVPEGEWAGIQEVERRAFREAMPRRDSSDIDYWLKVEDLEAFKATRLDPSVAVSSGELNPNQSFAHAVMVVAYEGETPVGVAYNADNTSGGNAIIRGAKMMSTARRYAWFKEMAVRPDFQRRGIAYAMTALILGERHPQQPATAYVWKDLGYMGKILGSIGFKDDGSNPSYPRPFGKKRPHVVQHRLVAPSCDLVTKKIMAVPGAESALDRDNLVVRDA